MPFNLGCDIDGTLLVYPQFYAHLLATWPGKRYILTGRSIAGYQGTLKDLEKNGILYGRHFDGLLMFPHPSHYQSDLPFVEAPLADSLIDEDGMIDGGDVWKGRVCRDYNIKVMFEDNPHFARGLREHGVYVLMPSAK